MAIDDYSTPEVAITAAITAAVCSPKIHQIIRKGVVYSLAGLMTVKDKVSDLISPQPPPQPNRTEGEED